MMKHSERLKNRSKHYRRIDLANVKIIPVSATEGDNVTTKSDNMPWYKGEPLLNILETVDVT